MRKKITGFLLCSIIVAGFVACFESKPEASVHEDELAVDEEFPDTFVVDGEELGMPFSECLFDDFIYRFMHDEAFQLSRVAFPLPCREDGKNWKISRDQWAFDSIYSASDEYTTIYDGREVIEQTCDSLVKKITLEVVDLRKERVRLYLFVRREQQWWLNEIDEHDFDHDNNHGFFSFYGKFSNDEDFQQSHILDPFYFKTYDNENFQEIEGWVAADQWPDYRTYLPKEKLLNIIYDGVRPKSAYRTFSIGSPSSGMSCTLIFKHIQGDWLLVSLEN